MRITRLWNWNYSGAFLLLGLILGPLILWGMVHFWTSGAALRNVDGLGGWITSIGLTVFFVYIAVVFIWVALDGTELWVEIGDQVSYRTLLRTHTHPWSEVVCTRFENRESQAQVKFLVVPLGVHRLFTMELTNGRRLIVQVDRTQEEEIESILCQHEAVIAQFEDALDDDIPSVMES